MEISRRVRSVVPGGDDGWGVYYRARARAAAGVPTVMLSIGEHDMATPPAILDAMDRAARDGATGYAPVPGEADLRAAVADRVARQSGVATGPENVLIVPGGQAGLFAAHMLALEPGDAGLYLDPYYATYPGTIRAAGGRDVPVACDPERGFAPDIDRLAQAAAESGAQSLLVNSPNNPVGRVYPETDLEALAGVCKAADLWLVSDEVYESQVWTGRHLSPRALPGMAARTLVIGSMSKGFAMTGSRLGWVVGPDAAIAALADLATHTTYGVPGYIQAAALWALTEGGAALEAEVAAPFRRRRAEAARRCAGSAALRLLPIEGSMFAFADIRATGLSGIAFAEALLDREGIAVMPGESFGAAAAGHIRIALTAPDAVLGDALDRLVRFAEACAAAPAPAGSPA